MKLELVYIGGENRSKHFDESRFIYGQVYKAVSFTQDTTTFLDKDEVPLEFSNDMLHYWFRPKNKWREEQIDKII